MISKTLPAHVRNLGDLEVEAVMTTSSVDAEGDVIDPRGWRLDRYKANPVVLLGHDHKSLPVGKVTDIRPTRNGLAARIAFPTPGISPRADEVRELAKADFLNTVSVGFRPIKSSPSRARSGGTDYAEQELLELSFVSIPANAEALVVGRAAKGRDGVWRDDDGWIELADDCFQTKA